jgi:hypothetical protein
MGVIEAAVQPLVGASGTLLFREVDHGRLVGMLVIFGDDAPAGIAAGKRHAWMVANSAPDDMARDFSGAVREWVNAQRPAS